MKEKLIESDLHANIYIINKLGDTDIKPLEPFSAMDIKDFLAFFKQELSILNRVDWFYFSLNNHRNLDLQKITDQFNNIQIYHEDNYFEFLTNLKNLVMEMYDEHNYPHMRMLNNYLIRMYRQINDFLALQPEYHDFVLDKLISN